MAKRNKEKGIYDKGSVLPLVIEAERELRKREDSAHRRAAEIVEDAKHRRERKLEETRRSLPALESAERNKLLDSVDERVEDIRRHEEEDMRRLAALVDKNRERAIGMILREVAPSWSGRPAGREKQGNA